MFKITLAQMRRSIGRLVAAGIAIALGTGFVAATFMGTAILNETVYNNLTASFGDADIVVSPNQGGYYFDDETEPTYKTASDIATVEGVEEAVSLAGAYVTLTGQPADKDFEQTSYGEVRSLPQHPRLITEDLILGRFPQGPGEISLPSNRLEQLGVNVGDSITARAELWWLAEENGTEVPVITVPLTIVGQTDQRSILGMSGQATYLWPSDYAEFAEVANEYTWSDQSAIIAIVKDGYSASEVMEQIRAELDTVQKAGTIYDAADDQLAQFLPAALSLSGIVLIFAIIALAVAAMVITNTFQVLVAQRTHTLAMLRCVGASAKQIRQNVRTEAAILGGIAAAGGVLFAGLLVQGGLLFARSRWEKMHLPATVDLSVLTILVPILAGVLVAFLASRAAAYTATRVPAIAALRPLDPPTLQKREGRVRLFISCLLILAGLAGVINSWFTDYSSDVDSMSLVLGVLGGLAAFSGILLSIPFWLPKALNWISQPFKKTGPMSRLAIANAQRNPRRTSATSAALLIGVTLVTTVSVGASIGKASINASIDDVYAIDVEFQVETRQAEAVMARLNQTEGIAGAVELREFDAIIQTADGKAINYSYNFEFANDWTEPLYVRAADTSQLPNVLRGDSNVNARPGNIVLDTAFFIDPQNPEKTNSTTGAKPFLTPGETVIYSPGYVEWDDETGEPILTPIPGVEPVELVAYPSTSPHSELKNVIDESDIPSALRDNFPDWSYSHVWLKIADLDKAASIIKDLEENVLTGDTWIGGQVQQRLEAEQVINLLLNIVYGLLAIAILIAVVGVTNTLSLSVIERRRESATMRAIGLSTAQLRRTLSIEGIFIAAAGAFLGIVIGGVFGWLGLAMIVEKPSEDISIQLPWLTLAVTFIGAIVAGLLASWVPARMASKTSPVEALATE